MKLFGRNAEGHPKALVVLVTVLLVASGLCGLQYAILKFQRGGIDGLVIFFGVTGVLELAVMFCCLGLIVVVLIAWGFAGLFRTKDRSPQETDNTNSAPKEVDPS